MPTQNDWTDDGSTFIPDPGSRLQPLTNGAQQKGKSSDGDDAAFQPDIYDNDVPALEEENRELKRFLVFHSCF